MLPRLCLLAVAATAYTTLPRARRRIALRPLGAVSRGTGYYGAFPDDLAGSDKMPRAPLTFEDPAAAAVALPPELVSGWTAALLGVALYLGPDWILAPLGLDTQLRPGRAATAALGRLVDADSAFARDSAAGFAADAPLPLEAATWALFLVLGFLTENACVAALGSSTTYVAAWAASIVLAASVYEVGRGSPGTRDEVAAEDSLAAAFEDFAESRFEFAGAAATNTIEIVRAFRRATAKYRNAEGSGVSDVEIERLAKKWWRRRQGAVTSSGFLKGIKLKTEADIFR